MTTETSSPAAIKGFFGEYRWLSNFWPVEVQYDGVTYPSVEHAYQAAKTLDLDEREVIRSNPDPKAAKRQGKMVTMREDWERVKVNVMTNLVYQKFRHPAMQELLLATGDAYLEETNHWRDRFWGVYEGFGINRLGKILMEVRSHHQMLE